MTLWHWLRMTLMMVRLKRYGRRMFGRAISLAAVAPCSDQRVQDILGDIHFAYVRYRLIEMDRAALWARMEAP